LTFFLKRLILHYEKEKRFPSQERGKRGKKMKISKVVERTGKQSGKKYFVVNVEGDKQDYLTFDWVAKDIIGKDVEAETYESKGTWYIRIKKESNSTNITQGETKKFEQRNPNDIKIGTTLSYAKDVSLGIITTYMNTHPDYPVDSAVDYIENVLPRLHKLFLDALISAEKEQN
jgi:hypothetical protein